MRRRRKKLNRFVDESYKNEILFYSQKIFLNFDIESKLNDTYNQEVILNFLGENFKTKKIVSSYTILDKNIEKLSKIINLDEDEKKFFRFVILLLLNQIFQDITELLGELSIFTLSQVLSKILDIELEKVTNILTNSILIKSNFISINNGIVVLNNKFDIIHLSFAEKMAYFNISIFEMLKDYIKKTIPSTLTLDDYSYIKDIKYILKYLQTPKKGVNILFYGLAGTGKTELSKLIAYKLNRTLYELSLGENFPIQGLDRIKPYKIAQTILDKNSIILFDEAEDLFNRDFKRQKAKAYINNLLETNKIPTIWITNDINAIDEAIIRRFDYVLEFKIPPKKIRKKIIKKYANLSPKTIKLLSYHKFLTPAVIERNIKVWKSCSKDEKILIKMINNTLIAQGYSKITKKLKKRNIIYQIFIIQNL